jgi:hypothetical protein
MLRLSALGVWVKPPELTPLRAARAGECNATNQSSHLRKRV